MVNKKRTQQKPSSVTTHHAFKARVAVPIVSVIFSTCLWLVCLGAIWLSLSQSNFFYSTWYQWLNIDQTIASYSPQNKFGKQNFFHTSAKEHARLFSNIVTSINHHGEGLAEISYQLKPSSAAIKDNYYPLLTRAEIIHLQDVANVITAMKKIILVAFVLAVALGVIIIVQKIPLASLKKQGSITLVCLILCALAIFVVGAEEIFYWLHEVIFPDKHQWFFYYQDSLMSTLMQAPNIFAPIAVLWVLLTILLWAVVMALFLRLNRGATIQ